MAVKTIVVDGVEHLVILERGTGDGGAVVSYISPDKDGFHVNKRDWYSDPSLAADEFTKADDVKLRDKRTAAIEMVTAVVAVDAIQE